jgi:hypothetical protein
VSHGSCLHKIPDILVWISGGIFEFHATGAAPFYDGTRFARDGVVCVTIGYRVGAEGFLYLAIGIANLGYPPIRSLASQLPSYTDKALWTAAAKPHQTSSHY